ncbi:hypothetical protein ELY33_17390 [Vreelandella andesensis]|uniref:Uncharacterized protein n=1 Tax=Vreelandella andesensis TaxID=447567 RepID=A0A3S0YPE2_9GAMM|nr:hypothetical protein [Halomonas andesensis]RUR26048.1 hypothetical protein ELY33_17390 [Halomonas andesensis]
MNNKLVPVIINNPCQKSWDYRIRDFLITLATLALWGLVAAKLYMFFIVEEAIIEQLIGSVMIKIVLIGFLVTFLTFHCWAVYNKYLHTSYVKRQLRHFQQPTLGLDNEIEGPVENQTVSKSWRTPQK